MSWLASGCVALAGLARFLDNYLVGGMLMVPAVVLALVSAPGWFYVVFDGWPVLTPTGVGAFYFLPGVMLVLVSAFVERARRARSGKSRNGAST